MESKSNYINHKLGKVYLEQSKDKHFFVILHMHPFNEDLTLKASGIFCRYLMDMEERVLRNLFVIICRG